MTENLDDTSQLSTSSGASQSSTSSAASQPSTSSAALGADPTVDNPNHLVTPMPSERRKTRKDIQADFLHAYQMECENRKVRAEEKQKRHEEKMEKFEKITKILETMANNMSTH